MDYNENNLAYFQKEMAYLDETRALFIKNFPKVAPFLDTKSKDPDVESIIENMAILTSRIRQELDENIPLIAESLVNILMPSYTNPFPSVCMQEFTLRDDFSGVREFIPKGSIVESKQINGITCKFQTIFDINLLPLKITKAFMSNNKSDYLLNLNISITKDELSTKELDIDFLNLYLGDNVYFSSTLLMWLKNYLKFITISFEDSDQEIKLSPDKLSLDEFDERLIKSDEFGFEAFELLKELSFFPSKLNFVRLNGLSFLKNFSTKSFNIKFIFSKDMPSGYVPRLEYFSLFVTPAINLFAMSAEPILNNNRRSEYRIFLDRSNIDAYEIVSINKVVAHSSNNEKRILKNYKSFERFEFLNDERAKDYYFVSNKTDIKLNSYKEISFFKSDSKDQTISIDALCCNGDLPCKLKLGEIDRVLSHQGVTTKNLTIPTSVKRVKIDGNLLWKLVSILSFSYQSILEKGSFLALLNTFSTPDDEFFKKFANSLYDIKTKQIYRVDQGFAKRGLLCIFYIDESEFESIGNVYTLGINLAKFLSKFASINSFCELKIKCIKSKILLNYDFLGGTKKLI